MTLPGTALAILVLLATPGPTNTLLALAGAERGWRGALRLIPAELAGYLATVVPLSLAGAALLARLPGARDALALLAAAWVLLLAWRLWREEEGAAGPSVTARRVAVTTLLNPKALVFGLVLVPAPAWGALLLHLLAFAVLVVVVASAWAALGALLRGRGAALPGLLRRLAALFLALLALWLAWGAAT